MTFWELIIPLPDGPAGTLLRVELPAGATVRKIAAQGPPDPVLGVQFYLWALVCVDQEKKEHRLVLVVGTGHEWSAEALKDIAWIGAQQGKPTPYAHQETALALDGRLVFHFFVSHADPRL